MFKWKSTFSCNIEEIDSQHKRLFEIAHKLWVISTEHSKYTSYDKILDVFDELREYTIFHFDFEEKLLLQYDYPEYASHKIQHDFFIKRMEKIKKQSFLEEKEEEAIGKLIEFIADWITNHICESDKSYSKFLIEKGHS